MRRLHPLIADEQHGLSEIERGIGRIDRKGDDLVGQRHFVIVEAGAFRAEQKPRFSPAATRVAASVIAASARQYRLQLAALPRRRREDAVEIGDRLFEASKSFAASSRCTAPAAAA